MMLNTVNEIDNKINEAQVIAETQINNTEFIDRSDELFKYMNFVAIANKSFLNLK